MSKKILSLDDIFAASDLRERIVDVPQWGGAVKIRELTRADQNRIRKEATGPDGSIDAERLETLLLAACLADPKVTLDQVERLREKSSAAWEKILWAILELNGMTEEAQKRIRQSFR